MTANVVTNLHENEYSELVDLENFRHKEIVEYWNNKNHQTIVRGGANYCNMTMKLFQGLVLGES